jgi:hypothetical protein
MRYRLLPAILIPVLSLSSGAWATMYLDATGSDHYGGPEVDIADVVITNDASNITFHIDMNPSADLGTNHFANYEIGIQKGTGAGGQTAINGTFGTGDPTAGTPWGNSVGISTGMNYFIGSFLYPPGPPFSYNGGAQLYSYSSASGWTQVGSSVTTNEVATGTPFTAFTFPLSSLGLNPGDSFHFDVWTTFGSPQGAYDALDNAASPANSPFGSSPAYDSATAAGSTFATTVYTVTPAVPEPMSAGLLMAGLIGTIGIRRRR